MVLPLAIFEPDGAEITNVKMGQDGRVKHTAIQINLMWLGRILLAADHFAETRRPVGLGKTQELPVHGEASSHDRPVYFSCTTKKHKGIFTETLRDFFYFLRLNRLIKIFGYLQFLNKTEEWEANTADHRAAKPEQGSA